MTLLYIVAKLLGRPVRIIAWNLVLLVAARGHGHHSGSALLHRAGLDRQRWTLVQGRRTRAAICGAWADNVRQQPVRRRNRRMLSWRRWHHLAQPRRSAPSLP